MALVTAIVTSVGMGAWSTYGSAQDNKVQVAGSADEPAGLQSSLAPVSTETVPAPSKPPPRPPEPVVPDSGDGQFRAAEGQSVPIGSGTTTSYRVEVEGGLPWSPDEVAAVVDSTLADSRGWNVAGHSFQRTTTAALRIRVATPSTVDRLCAPLRTRGEMSCRNGNFVVLNAKRWNLGIEAFQSISGYRRYLVNHEVGHALGYSHRTCPSPGQLAPVMQQQTKSMQSCRPNSWPTTAELTTHK